MTGQFPRSAIAAPTYRLIPSRFPPISAFDAVSSPEDLEGVMDLEGWTNDRLVKHRLARLPHEQWVFGTPNASIVMAAFLHAAPGGLRFSSGELGAWYAGLSLRTSIAEVSHHLRREAANAGRSEMRGQYRAYQAQLEGRYVDIRGRSGSLPDIYAKASYRASQVFGEAVRWSDDRGILYDSLRHRGGANVVCYRPKSITAVQQTAHYEIMVPERGRIAVRVLGA